MSHQIGAGLSAFPCTQWSLRRGLGTLCRSKTCKNTSDIHTGKWVNTLSWRDDGMEFLTFRVPRSGIRTSQSEEWGMWYRPHLGTEWRHPCSVSSLDEMNVVIGSRAKTLLMNKLESESSLWEWQRASFCQPSTHCAFYWSCDKEVSGVFNRQEVRGWSLGKEGPDIHNSAYPVRMSGAF